MLEGQPDYQGAGDQGIDGLPGPEATGGRRLRGCVEPQATGDTGGCTDFRWRERSQIDCAGLFQTSQGRARWTLRLLEEKVVELQIVDRASDSTIGRALKKHSPAPSPAVLGHPAEGQWRVRSRHGRRAGGLYAATRSRLPAGVPGRDLQAAPCRDAPADPDEAGTPGPLRLRVRAQRHRQHLHDVCTARRLAPCQSHRSPYRRGLRSRLELADRYFANAKTVV